MGMFNGCDLGVIFIYEISSIRVDFKEIRTLFGVFVLGICFVIGGVVIMVGIM